MTLKKYLDVWNGTKNKIEALSSGECDCGKDYMKIKFNSDDDLPLSKSLKLFPQDFLDDALSELSI